MTRSFENSDQVEAVVMQADGKIVAVGQTFNNSTDATSLAVAGYIGN